MYISRLHTNVLKGWIWEAATASNIVFRLRFPFVGPRSAICRVTLTRKRASSLPGVCKWRVNLQSGLKNFRQFPTPQIVMQFCQYILSCMTTNYSTAQLMKLTRVHWPWLALLIWLTIMMAPEQVLNQDSNGEAVDRLAWRKRSSQGRAWRPWAASACSTASEWIRPLLGINTSLKVAFFMWPVMALISACTLGSWLACRKLMTKSSM